MVGETLVLDYIGVKTNPNGASVIGCRDSYTQYLNTHGTNKPSTLYIRIPPNMTARYSHRYSEYLQHNVYSSFLSVL